MQGFRKRAQEENAAVQMTIPMAEVAAFLQEGVGHLLPQAGLAWLGCKRIWRASVMRKKRRRAADRWGQETGYCVIGSAPACWWPNGSSARSSAPNTFLRSLPLWLRPLRRRRFPGRWPRPERLRSHEFRGSLTFNGLPGNLIAGRGLASRTGSSRLCHQIKPLGTAA